MGIGMGIGIRGGGGWSPAALWGLRAWGDCSRAVYQDPAMTVVALAGDPVGGVPDRSGREHHALQGTTSLKPTRVLSAFPSGRGGLSFDGVEDRLILSGLGSSFSGSDVPFSVGMVFKVTDTASRAVQGLGYSASSASYAMVYVTGSALTQYRRDDSLAWVSLSGPALAVNQAQAIIATFGESPGVVARILVNRGVESVGTMDVGVTTVDRFVIGAVERSGSPLYPFKGVIGCWVVVARVLNAAERKALSAYLMDWAGV